MTIRTSNRANLLSWLLGALLAAGVATTPAHAQRSWVSGVGDDNNPCTRTAPCKTWSGALTQTPAGGEIDALDPGGFGGVTINKAITLDGGGGIVASTMVSGTPGITIAAGPTDVVILRNLRFNGLLNSGGTTGTTGINVLTAGRVVIEKCAVFGFATTGIGIFSTGTVSVKIQETTSNNNGAGISAKPTGGTVDLAVEHAHADNNVGGGMRIDGTASGAVNATITDSTMSLNGSNGLNALSGTANVAVDVERVTISENGGIGIQATNANGGNAVVTVGSSIISNNVGNAWANPSGTAALLSFKNNQVTGPIGVAPTMASFQ